MANTLRIKRRWTGAAGAPASLMSGELAYNGLDNTLYLGYGDDGAGNATSVQAIAGSGAFVPQAGNYTIDGIKTYSSSPLLPTPTGGDNSTKAATTAFVQAAIAGVAGSVADGDKGDVTVTSGVWAIDAGAVSLAKMASLAANSIIGNNTGASATPAALSVGQVKTMLALNNVENTALSTWAGSANITTVGTIANGTWNGTAISALKGGTGLTSYTLGDLIYCSAANTLAKLAGNTAASKQFLSQTGTGTVSAAPAWTSLVKGDVGLGNVDNTSDANKPVSTATQAALNAKVDASSVGAANGVASLDATGKVPSAQLPSFVDDVLEYANLAAFPATGTAGVMYVALDTNKVYRWSGSAYIEISASPGSTDAVPEGSTNLYYTATRARGDVIASAIASGDTTHAPSGGAVFTALAGKLAAANDLSDLANAGTARTNLGLGTMATQNANAVAISGGTIDGVTLDGGTF